MPDNIYESDVEFEFSKKEAKAIDDYIKDIYSKKVKEPERGDLSFWKIAGIEASIFLLVALGVIVFSSIRTGGLFFILESLLLQKFNINETIKNGFSFVDMVASLMAFELFVAGVGFARGKANTDVKISRLGEYASLTVIVLAGVFSGIGLIKIDSNIETWFYIVIALSTALAGGIVAIASGENIGYTFSKVSSERKRIIDEHREEHQRWLDGAIKAYNTSHYNLASKRSAEFFNSIKARAESSQNERSLNNSEQTVQNELNVHKSISKLEIVYQSIEQFVQKYNRMPTTDELVNAGASRAYASLAMNQFTVNNADKLIKGGVVNQERVNKAVAYMQKNSS